jgi:hypothetical protein
MNKGLSKRTELAQMTGIPDKRYPKRSTHPYMRSDFYENNPDLRKLAEKINEG